MKSPRFSLRFLLAATAIASPAVALLVPETRTLPTIRVVVEEDGNYTVGKQRVKARFVATVLKDLTRDMPEDDSCAGLPACRARIDLSETRETPWVRLHGALRPRGGRRGRPSIRGSFFLET